MGFLKSIKEKLNNEYADLVSTGVAAGDITNFVDTGSYILNAMLSGSIYKGIAGNKIIALAGEETTGKTFFLLGIVKNFLDSNPKAEVVIFESESSMTKDMIEQRGCDSSRIMIAPVATVQEFRTQALKVIDEYLAIPESKRPPLLLGLDSLGMLSTSKEMEDTASGSETRDMTRAQVIKATFRVLTLKLGKAQVPMIVTNHVYAEQGTMYPSKIMSGGSALRYSGNNIIYLSKRKEKDKKTNEVVGNIIHCTNKKSRTTIEHKMVDVMLTYAKGLDRYYGLADLAVKHGIFKKVSTRIQLPDGKTAFQSEIHANPEKYFTKEILDQLDQAAFKEFTYGQGGEYTSNSIAEEDE